jgi:hypothetical protein
MGRMPAGGAWMRRTASAALAALVVTTAVTGSSSAASVGDGPFLVAQPALTWPCSPQAVHIDEAGAPSPEAVAVVRAALERFRAASGRSWPETSDPSAPVRIRWYDPAGHLGALTVLGGDARHYVGADVQLSPSIRPGWLYSSLLHELGHVGGLAHVSDSAEVMGLYPSTPHDRYQVGDLVGLRLADRPCLRSAAAT